MGPEVPPILQCKFIRVASGCGVTHVPRKGMSLGSGHRAIYSRKLCCPDTRFPLVLNRAVHRCGDRVLCNEMAICQFYFLLDATADSLPATPCSFNAIGRRRGNREWTRVRVSVWVAISIGVKRTGVNKSEKGYWTDTRLHLPCWRVEARWDVTAGKRLLFYLFVFILTALSAELL